MRTKIFLLAVVILASSFSVYAKGGAGGRGCYNKTEAECQAHAAELKVLRDQAAQQREQEEKAEQAKVAKAMASGLEQVKELYASEQEINFWLRTHPTVKVVRVVPVVGRGRDSVLIFYRKSNKR